MPTNYFSLPNILNLFIICILILFIGCQQASEEQVNTSEKTINIEVEVDNEQLLRGECNREAFQLENYKHWFDSTYAAYRLDTSVLEQIASFKKDLSLDIYLGTWCSDSRREVPALYKILDYLEMEEANVHQVCVDRTKSVPGNLMTIDSLEYVPTIVVYNQMNEVGRIIEFPMETLEKDLISMLNE